MLPNCHEHVCSVPGHKPVCPGDFVPAGMRRMDVETQGKAEAVSLGTLR